MHTDISKRHDFVLLFDVTDGNPNGDPDAGNLPRIDPETMQGIVTDVCLKRKVRDWVDRTRGMQERFKIYVQRSEALITKHKRAYKALDIDWKSQRQNIHDVNRARDWMCNNFYDIRVFGAVMSVTVNCGQVRGPIQLTFARSIDPVTLLDLSITRVAITKEEQAAVAVAEDDDAENRKNTEMGRKSIVPYGLYRAHGFVSPHLARDTGATDEDLALFWEALQSMWDADRSASRGLMACRGLYVFTHDRATGNAPAHTLFEQVVVTRNPEVETPRHFSDYTVRVPDETTLPVGVTLTRLVG